MVPTPAPQLRAALRRLPRLPLHRAWFRRLSVQLLARMKATPTAGVRIESSVVDGVGLRIYRPDSVQPTRALLWIHGGGLIIGGAVQDDRLCGATVRELGIVVVSIDYRLAPEHPYPAALDDSMRAWKWLQDNAATLGIDSRQVVVGGQSAGGGLAAALAQRIRDTGQIQPLGQWLFSPMLDDRTAARRELDRIRHHVWDNRLNRFGWRSYLADEPGSAHIDPRAVPARAETLEGLPPAWLGVGDIELFSDEIREYARRLDRAGVHVTLHEATGAPHGFETWAHDTDLARRHIGAAHRWLRDLFAGAHSEVG
ncbi:alpha/beta hydrolase [Nocardia goodfellowii]